MKSKDKNEKINVYRSYADEFVESRNQQYKLPDSYVWIRDRGKYRILSWFLYQLAKCIGRLYCHFVLHLKVVNEGILKTYRNTGFFLYGNHTQPVGDVVIPALVCRGKRIYTIVSPANLGIPVIGKALPLLGAIPVPDKMDQMKEHWQTVERRIGEGYCVVIYPEAHVWPYYTEIRPFGQTSFMYPAEMEAPVFCMTATYQKNRLRKKPDLVLYIDGPFFPDMRLKRKERQKKLWEAVYETMKRYSFRSNSEYIIYRKEEEG